MLDGIQTAALFSVLQLLYILCKPAYGHTYATNRTIGIAQINIATSDHVTNNFLGNAFNKRSCRQS